MIATIATVCLVASTSAANLPFQKETRQDGRDLAYTAGFQGLGEQCDRRTTKTLCKQGLFCHLTSPETGICLDGTYVETTVATGPGLGEPCDVENLCKEGLFCHILAPGNGQCVATDTTLVRKLTSRKLASICFPIGAGKTCCYQPGHYAECTCCKHHPSGPMYRALGSTLASVDGGKGHQLSYTQSLGESCDMVSYYCKQGLKCTTGVFGTGKCVEGENFATKIPSPSLV